MPLEDSFAHCRRIARSRAKNFYYAFLLLPAAERDAMCSIYAFMRYCDDLSDEPGATREALAEWRAALDRTLAGDASGHLALPAFGATVERYKIPPEYFYEMIDGVTSDLEPRRIGTFDELYRYCYQVASVVGLTTVHVFGFDSPEALPLAEKCGVAFQLTNILRDVREDAGRGRIYLPGEDLAKFGVSPADLAHGGATTRFRELMRYEATRARDYYRQAEPLPRMIRPPCRRALRALIGIYSSLLGKIERSNYDVLRGRISLSAPEKLWAVANAAFGG
ncbi:MAG: phytoene/squalene synthase family protein [Bryobacteraceae bacterium]